MSFNQVVDIYHTMLNCCFLLLYYMSKFYAIDNRLYKKRLKLINEILEVV